MKKTIFTASLAALAMVSGCTISMEESPVIQEEGVEYIIGYDEEATKVYISDEGKVTWKAGDRILIITDTDERETVTVAAKDIFDNGRKARIHLNVSGSRLTAVTPAEFSDNVSVNGLDLTFSCPTNIKYDKSSVYYGSTSQKEGKRSITFKPAMCVFKVRSDDPNADRIIFFGRNSETLNNDFTINVVTGSYSRRAPKVSEDTIYAEFDPETHIAYIPVCPTIKFNKGLSFTMVRKGQDYAANVFVTLKEFGSSPGKLYDIGTMNSDLSLGDKGIANCFIMKPGEAGSIYPYRGTGVDIIEGVKSAQAIWESNGTAVPPQPGEVVTNVEYSAGFINFKVPETCEGGNALIAAMDSHGDILWSWHIWVCKDYDPKESAVTFKNGSKMMDRNLGALSKTGDTSIGLYYQWGRKDPFPLIADFEGTHAKVCADTYPIYTISESGIEDYGTHLDWATSNPFCYIISQDSLFDWYTHEENLVNDDLWSSSKTIFDPCPTGWRVPDDEFFTNAGVDTNSGWRREGNYAFTDPSYANDALILPCTGMYPPLNPNNKVTLWTCTAQPMENVASIYYIDGAFENGIGSYKAAAMPVRCCKD